MPFGHVNWQNARWIRASARKKDAREENSRDRLPRRSDDSETIEMREESYAQSRNIWNHDGSVAVRSRVPRKRPDEEKCQTGDGRTERSILHLDRSVGRSSPCRLWDQ